MQIYYPNLPAIEQQTMQLDNEQCIHCKQTQQLVSHGFIYKKQARAESKATGKRVVCSQRYRHTGCGRTMQLYLDSTVRYLHYASWQVVAFVLALMAGMTVQQAYYQATGCAEARHAYRWLTRLYAQFSCYRSLWHQPPLPDTASPIVATPLRRGLLASTFKPLLQRFGQPLCAHYQGTLQRSFV